MDLPQYLHHHHPRYAPVHPPSSHPYPSDPPNFPNYPHRHHHNYHHHVSQPPPQPQQPPQLHQPLPPPPPLPPSYHPVQAAPPPPPPPQHPYKSTQPQLTFSPHHRPIESELSRTFHHSLHDFAALSPRVSHRATLNAAERPRHHRLPQFDRPYLESGPDSWVQDPPRSYPPIDFERELHKPQFRLDSHSESTSARFRAEYKEQLLWDQRVDDSYRRRAHVESNSDASYHELGFVSNQNSNSNSKNLNSNSGGYDGRYDELIRSGRRDEVYENQRWGNDRQGSRDLYDPFEIDEGDGARIVSGKREYYGSESGRSNSSSSNRRKQIQKKSALLRLQTAKPSHRNYSAYFDNSSSGSIKGKEEHYEYSGHGMDEEERGGSPLELDVSFKSNSLVAKTVRNRNFKKDSGSDRDCSNSQPTKLNEEAVNLDSPVFVENKTSNPGKDPRQLEDEVTTSGIESKCGIISQPCSNVTDDLCGKSEVERVSKGKVLQKDGNNVSSGRISSVKVAKKKKVVKKVVKKVINPHSRRKNKIGEPVAADSVIHSPTAALGTDKGEASSFSDPCPRDVHVLPVNNNVEGSPLKIVSDEYRTAVNSCSKSTGNESTSDLGSSSHEEINIDQGPLNVDISVEGLIMTSNFNNVTESLRLATCPEIGGVVDVSKQICQSGDCLLLDNVIRKESSEPMSSVKGYVNSGSLNSEKIKMHEDIVVNVNGSGHGSETTLDIDSGIKLSHQEIIVHDIGTVDATNEQPCRYQFPTSLQNGFVEELPKAISSVESSVTVGLPSSGETVAVCSNYDRGTTWNSDKVCNNYDYNITVSNGGNVDLIGKQPSPDGASRLFEICATERSPNITKSVGDSKSVTPKIKKKRKMKTHSDISTMSDTHVESVNVSTHQNAVDTTVSSSLKDPSHAEVSVSGDEKLDIGSQPGNGGVSVLHGNSSVDGFCEAKFSARSGVNCDHNETSPKYIKRRKVSASHLVLTTSQTNEGPADKSTFYTEASLTSNDDPTQQEDGVAASTIGFTANLMPSQEGNTVFLEDNLAGVSSEAVAAAKDAFTNEHQGIDCCSIYEESVIPDTLFLCPAQSRNDQKEDGTRVVVVNNHQLDVMNIEHSHEENFDVCATNEQEMIRGDTALCKIPSEQPPDLGNKFASAHMESDYLSVKDTLPFVSSCLLFSANGNEVFTTNSHDEGMDSVPDTLSDTGSPETSTDVPDMHLLTCNPSVMKISDGKACGDDQKLDVQSVVEGGSSASSRNLFSECSNTNLRPDHVTEGDQSVMGKTVALPLQDSKKTTHGVNLISAESGLKNQLGQATSRTVPGRSFSVFTTSKKTGSSTHIAKPRTWHRNSNSSSSPIPASMPFSSTVPPQKQLPHKSGKFPSNSYVRKGNSLVRKPAPVAAVPQSSHGFGSSVYQLNCSGIDGLKKNAGSDSRVDVKNPSSLVGTGGMNAPFDRPTPPLPNGAKLSTSSALSSVVYTSSPLVEPSLSGYCETTSGPMNSLESKDEKRFVKDSSTTSETQENHSGQINNLETEPHDGNLALSDMKQIVYVKRKLNQLVATPNPCDLSIHNADKIQSSSFDGYYKRRKNQLIRTSLESHAKQAVPDGHLNSEVQRAFKVVPSRTFSKNQLHKAVAKTSKTRKNSLVWTPRGTQSSNNDGISFDHQKVLPHLFPWKRARYWKSFMQSQAPNSNYISLSTISKKLLLSRMRDTVYTKSTHGFSLRKYKVLSVGGSSLKWSKSIESRSKKANEEATRAVAAVEKKKREHNGTACISSGSKIRNNSLGKRIFRIGSVRYKMDPSRRTLKRISDDESSSSAVLNPEKDAKRSYVPRRLVIGNDEYVRIGNGNQLIRDPKKRTRILASERVRWSLHTARLRLAKKRKYCQFFTRFGKCNKDDGKCPYIHDPSKVAVCTKFLNGLCSNPNCNLTHKVIPERMPDCSYFLQGLCTNQNCPYRHVNVNPKASTCEGFLKGYCADGNECRKKHSYVCPTFEATGTCPQGPKCKLHHPRKRTKGKKRKRSREQKNAWGRYFVSKDINVSEPRTVSGKHCPQNGDDIVVDGIADFISIDVSDEEAGESNDLREQTTFYDSDPSELELDDLDELIKPVRLLDRNLKTNIS